MSLSNEERALIVSMQMEKSKGLIVRIKAYIAG